MNRRYRRHYDDYAIGENEKLYSDMAARGWLLEKRGSYFSRFVRGEPADMRYRIEVSAPRFLEETALPEEQVAVYEDCGWEYVTSCGLIHVFASPAGSDAPEFYADPAQQAATLKALRRNYVWAWVPVTLMLLFNFFLAAAMSGGRELSPPSPSTHSSSFCAGTRPQSERVLPASRPRARALTSVLILW